MKALKMLPYRKLVLLVISLFILNTVIVPKVNGQNKWKKYFDKIEEARKNHTPCQGNCTCHVGVIDSDLKYWRNRGGITKEDFNHARSKGVHYQIVNHKLYRQSECMFPARCSGIEHFIVDVLKDMPDTEMVINVRDWPQTQKRDANPLPIFSFSKVNEQHRDIMYPAWTFWEGGPAVWPIYPRGLGRWDEMRKELKKKSEEWQWDKKNNIGFFRGSRTSALRDPLILLSRHKPELVDAQFTKNQAWKSDKDTLGASPAEPVHINEHCQYKYLFNFRGVAASFRLKHLFLCNSLVFHVGEDWIEFFYPALKPWIHYIPLPDNLNNLEELLEFAKDNDALMERIASRGHNFIVNHLKMSDVSCYWRKLLLEYSKLLKFDIKKEESYNRITRKSVTTTRKKKQEL